MTVVVQNLYFIKAGQEDEGRRTRRSASTVRAEAGRPAGRILVPVSPSDSAPTFVWECEYPSLEDREEDAAWADGSPEFSAVREHMGTLLERFERVVFEVDG